MRLNRKILLVTITTLAVTLLVSSLVNVANFRTSYTDALLRGSFGLGHGINGVLKEMFALGLPLESLSGMDQRMVELVEQNPHIVYAGIADVDGRAIFHSDANVIGRLFTDPVQKRCIAAKEPIWQLYDRFDGTSYYDVAVPVFDADGEHVGVIRLGFPVSVVDEEVFDAIAHVLVNVLLTFAVIALVLNFLLVRTVSRPVAVLSEHAERITGGRFETSEEIRGNDEIGALSRSLNRMAETLAGQFQALERNREELEGMVAERTRELALANNAMRHRNQALTEAMERQKELTEQAMRSEEALRENEERFRGILHSAGVGVFGLDLQGRHTFVNPVAAGLLGYQAEELLGKPSHSTWHFEHEDGSCYPEDECPIYGVLRSGEPAGGEEVFLNRRGKPFHVEFSATPIFEHGEINGAVVTFSDISERRRTERITQGIIRGTSSATGGDFLRQLVKNLAEALDVRYAFVGEVTDESLSAVRAVAVWAGGEYGDSFEYQLAGTPCADVVGREICGYRDHVRELFPEDRLLADMEAESYVGTPLFDSDGNPLGILAVLDDRPLRDVDLDRSILGIFAGRAAVELERTITDQRMRDARDRAEAANRAKSEFLAMMSHEIRTPMNAILGVTELLDDPLSEEERSAYLAVQKRAGSALLTLIDDILELSRLEAGVEHSTRTPFDLRALLHSVVSMLERSAREKGITIDAAFAEGVPAGWVGDERRIRQVLLNLAGNAVKFTHQGGVELKVWRDEARGVRIAVSDSGIGIPEAHQRQVFDSFYQVDSTSTRQHGGSGLGLAITRKLMDLMGGEITLESELERGSRFELWLPIGESAPGASEAVRSRPAAKAVESGRSLRILLAEDSPDNALLIQSYLKGSRHHITVVEDGEQAAAAVREQPFDLVLMDMQMPVMDGYEATRKIREEGHVGDGDLPILALTAHALEGDEEKCLAAGCDGYLTKPIKKAKLLEAIAGY